MLQYYYVEYWIFFKASITPVCAFLYISTSTITSDVIDAGCKLKILGVAGTTLENIDVKAATRKDIIVTNTPGVSTTSAVELTMSLVVALARKIPAVCVHYAIY